MSLPIVCSNMLVLRGSWTQKSARVETAIGGGNVLDYAHIRVDVSARGEVCVLDCMPIENTEKLAPQELGLEPRLLPR